jgi:hypothetical protein
MDEDGKDSDSRSEIWFCFWNGSIIQKIEEFYIYACVLLCERVV